MTALPLAPGVAIPHRYLTRHAGIFGATGTGKTTTLAAIVERAPCPVLLFDAKGDLESLGQLHRPWNAQARISAMGADFIARALNLSEAQSGAVAIALAWAEDTGVRVDTLGDLRRALGDCDPTPYGLLSALSVSATQRAMLRLERSAPWLFGASCIDWRDAQGVNVIACSGIAGVPGLYGAYVAHALDSLYRGLGEVGEVPTPGLLVMIDEAHLLFDGATPAIVSRLEQVTRLIRSKGVGLIYVTQSPADLPDAIAGQLATRVQHGLRAATPRQMKGVRAAAESMAGNVTADAIQRLGTGQAFVSVPDARGMALPARSVMIQRGKVALHSVAPEMPPVVAAVPIETEAQPVPVPVARRTPWWRVPLIIAAIIWLPVLFSL